MFETKFNPIKLHIVISMVIFKSLSLLSYKPSLFTENITNRIFILINEHYNNFKKESKNFITCSDIKIS